MASVAGPAPNRVCDVHIGGRDEAVTLRAVITTVFSTLEIDEVLAGVVDIATEATGLPRVPDLPRRRRPPGAARGVARCTAQFVGRIEMGFDEGVTGWVARTQRGGADPRRARCTTRA